jgi:mRNA interferase MazF
MQPSIHPKHGEIWLVEFDPVIGDEIGKRRPAVVLSRPQAGILQLRYVCPVTDWKSWYEDFPWFRELIPTTSNGLRKRSGADAYQCKSVSLKRFSIRLGTLERDALDDIIRRLMYCLREQ